MSLEHALQLVRHYEYTTNNRASGEVLETVFETLDALLADCLDGLMELFRATDPAFFAAYTAARETISHASGHARADGSNGGNDANGGNGGAAAGPTPTPMPAETPTPERARHSRQRRSNHHRKETGSGVPNAFGTPLLF